MVRITLTLEEWLHAATVGCKRQIDGLLRNREPGHGASTKAQHESGWYWNINGACGEKVVAKWLGADWDGSFGDLGAGDVGLIEVRTTSDHDYPLPLHPTDKDNSVYILVTGLGPTWQIQGYIMGSRGKQPAYFHDKPPPVKKSTGRKAYSMTSSRSVP